MIIRILCGMLAIFALGAGQPQLDNETVRLHVIARSDSAEDQAEKLRVKDEVLKVIEPKLEKCGGWDEAFEMLRECEGEILNAARDIAGDDIHVETGIFEYDDREYMGKNVPAGRYRAMQVVIGDGGGKNWWGVMFPQAMPFETDEDTIYYSAVIEWLFGLFGRDL